MIEVKELTKMHGGRAAVDRLSLTAVPGTVTAVLGPAGAGKTSALRLMLGLDSPTAGTVAVGGVPLRGRPRSPHQVGALPEAAALPGRRTARAFLRALARAHGIGSGRVAEVLAETGLAQESRRRVATYSPAMRQRLRIAAALLGDPPVLLLDEPLAGLDAEGVRWARRLLRTLAAQGRTVAITGERAAEAADTADRIVVLGRGRVGRGRHGRPGRPVGARAARRGRHDGRARRRARHRARDRGSRTRHPQALVGGGAARARGWRPGVRSPR
ncbi:ABC transporter ATP-binding protein [Streptomyces sp. NPDC091273]|uniref:ABC transporter ATP-binding protein n=1 Tax=Streptomyces sp. NPDC091273 TaxID=3365982 RepID=UPI00382DC9E0